MMISKSFRLARYLAPLAFVAVAACGSDKSTGPGDSSVTVAERRALARLFENETVANAALGGEADVWSSVALQLLANNLHSLGTLHVNVDGSASLITPNGLRQNVIPVRGAIGIPTGSYRAFGGQFVLTGKFTGEPDQHVIWTGIVAVNNLEEPTDVITTGVVQFDLATPTTSIETTSYDASDETKAAFGSYIHINGELSTSYQALSGAITIDNATFTGRSATCPGIAFLTAIKSCTHTAGNLQGSFNFTAKRLGGDETVTLPTTAVNIPATRMTITVEMGSVR